MLFINRCFIYFFKIVFMLRTEYAFKSFSEMKKYIFVDFIKDFPFSKHT